MNLNIVHTAFKDYPIKEVEEVASGVFLCANQLKQGFTLYDINGTMNRAA
jgi:hypothetical protein